jgi:tetratricopeptide (TPR) repeat protein
MAQGRSKECADLIQQYLDKPRQNTNQAERLKKQGNDAFAQKNYKKAIDLYTKAIEYDESNHILYSNRAACYIELGQPKKAKEDAIKCTGLAEDFVRVTYLYVHLTNIYNRDIID